MTDKIKEEKTRIILGVFVLALELTAYLIALTVNWRLALALFLIHWAINMEHNFKFKTIDKTTHI